MRTGPRELTPQEIAQRDKDLKEIGEDLFSGEITETVAKLRVKAKQLLCKVCTSTGFRYETNSFATTMQHGVMKKMFRIEPQCEGAGVLICEDCGALIIPEAMKPYINVTPMNRRQRRMVESDNRKFSRKMGR